jgi:DNA (cytosine-5)-methyltransferase 1
MSTRKFTFASYFCGAGGLDIGFDSAGYKHVFSNDIDIASTKTIIKNRPEWDVKSCDIKEVSAISIKSDVLCAGFPCQGFSLGGHREITDPRNELYNEAIRVTKESKPRVVVFENVLNLRKMTFDNRVSAAETIANALESIGYEVFYDSFRVSFFGAPQTRRRFIFIAFRDGAPKNYHLPLPDDVETTIESHLRDLAFDSILSKPKITNLSNNAYSWGFNSRVHLSKYKNPFECNAQTIVPLRLSRTASDGNPVRSFDKPFQALDTGTIWGWGAGNVEAERVSIDRINSKNTRNRKSTQPLWRINSDCIRRFSNRELARVQTFPDAWEFIAIKSNDIQKQIGNAVPVNFSIRIAENVKKALIVMNEGGTFADDNIKNVYTQQKLL